MNTIYNYDGKSHKCTWHPKYFNSDSSMGSTDGVCRDTNSPCFPTPMEPGPGQGNKCHINIDGKNNPIIGNKIGGYCFPDINKNKQLGYFNDIYCAHNHINSHEETCIKSGGPGPNCKKIEEPFKCVSDGKKYTIDGARSVLRGGDSTDGMKIDNNISEKQKIIIKKIRDDLKNILSIISK